jgi:AcrR family transcriptional regulator
MSPTGRGGDAAAAEPRRRLTAAERHDQVVDAAVSAFAESGYAGTTTDDVARRVGVSQPYVIQLFGTKQALFLAALNRACDRIEAAFRVAGAASADLGALGSAFLGLLGQRELLVLLLHGYAACADPAIGPVVRSRYGEIYALVRELSGADTDAVREFFGTGMLLTVLSAMDVVNPDLTGRAQWADDLLGNAPPGDRPSGDARNGKSGSG